MALLDIHDEALPAPLFRSLWRKVRALGDEKLGQSYWTSFWYPFDAPRNIVDRAVLALRARYFPELPLRGVEWWLGRTDLRRVPIELHCDRDNGLFEETGRLRHPRLSTVLYFNRVRGGCLLVTDQHPSRDGTRLIPPEPRAWALARPVPNRYVLFEGSKVHGVLDARNELPSRPLREPPGRLRYALVINGWGARPRGIPTWDGTVYRPLAVR